jgi:hypothetical protein
MPYKAETMVNGGICVTLRCPRCRHEWTMELAPNEIAFAPKRDRREVSRAY